MEKPHSTSNSPGSPERAVVNTYIKPQARKTHDADVKFEEYHYYAQRTREEEKTFEPPKTSWREILLRKKSQHDVAQEESTTDSSQQLNGAVSDKPTQKLEISDAEWTDASRAFRTASWGACQ
jgi:hypothetical protein